VSYAEQQTNRVVIDGIEIACRLAGDPDARPVVFFHGFTGNSRNWMLNFRPLAEAGYRTLSVDHPGHGRSSAPEDPACYRMEMIARIHHQVAERLGFVPGVVVGHSMGAAIAEEFALAYPADVEALVLVDSFGGSVKRSWIRSLDDYASEAARKVAFAEGMEALFDFQIATGLRSVDHLPADLRPLVRTEFARTSPTGYFHSALAMRNRVETLERLSAFDKPTLVLYGASEDRSFIRGSEELARTIPGSRIKAIEGAGHSPQFEQPDRFNAALLDFLDEVLGPAAVPRADVS
jgi:pimeloyl-ACP methyl ester carboxylesterase